MCAGQILICKGIMAIFTELQAVLISCMRNSILLSGKREAWGGHKSVPEHALDGGTVN